VPCNVNFTLNWLPTTAVCELCTINCTYALLMSCVGVIVCCGWLIDAMIVCNGWSFTCVIEAVMIRSPSEG
jgi:hypothetical protein